MSPKAAKNKRDEEASYYSHHDALSHYLDLVEVALLRQIYVRSPAFFRALDDIQALQYQVQSSLCYMLCNKDVKFLKLDSFPP